MKPKSLYWLLLIALLLNAALPARGAAALPAGPDLREGVFSVVWGNSNTGATPQTKYFLNTAEGETLALDVSEQSLQAQGGAHVLNKRTVTVRGTLDLAPAAEDALPLFRVTSLTASPASGAEPEAHVPEMAAVSGAYPWVSIMCKFSDVSAEPKNLAYFQGMFSINYPGLDHYWREQSYNIANVSGSTAVGWFTLPYPRSHYIVGNALQHGLAAQDCTNVADASVNFANVQGINLMFNDQLDGYAWGGSWYLTLDGVSKAWSMTWEPPWGYEDITVMSHEMGHGFGLPHSASEQSNDENGGSPYVNYWDVMSYTWDCANSTHATYGCLGQHTNMYHKDFLGWISGAKKFSATGGVATITLEQSALPVTANYLMAQIPIGGSSSHFYVVEVRRKVGYDVKLPGEAVIIHEVLTSRAEPAHVVDTDLNGNTGDAGAMWTVGETFTGMTNGVPNGISVHIDSQTATVFVVTITSPGNQPGIFNKSAPSNGATNQSLNPNLSWGASSGAASYEYCFDTSNDNACSAWVNNGTATSVALSGLANSTTYYWHARSVNGFGTTYANGSSTAFWSFTTTAPPPPPVTAGTYNDTHAAWAFTGTWTNATAASAYSGAYKTSSTVGASATVYFSGVQAKLFFTKNSTMGKLDVYIDNVKVAQINQYSLTAGYQKNWLSAVYPDGVHKIEFRRYSGKVNVDALQVIAAPPPPVPVGPGTYENTNSNWALSGTWSNATFSGASAGTVHTSNIVSNSASLLVTGASGFTLRYFTRSGYGTLDVYVDNVKVTSLIQSSGLLTAVWNTYTLTLTAGTHTIKLVDASGKVNFDNIIITQ